MEEKGVVILLCIALPYYPLNCFSGLSDKIVQALCLNSTLISLILDRNRLGKYQGKRLQNFITSGASCSKHG